MRKLRTIPALLMLPLAVACAPSGEAPKSAPPAPKEPLAALTEALAAGQVSVIDLTQTLNEKTPVIRLPPPFANTPGLQKHLLSRYDAKGPAWYWNYLTVGEHAGTHFDAPCHWVTGKDKPCLDTLPAAQFIGPAAVIDATAEVAANPDFVVTRQTILDWEKANGPLPAKSWVILRSGWSSRAQDAKAFLNVTDGAPHYPGFGKESAEFLTKERDVLGVGTEAIGTDAAVGATSDPPFPNHSVMHGAGKFGLTQLTNLDKLPAKGAVIIATPMKVEGASGSPVHAIALVPAARPPGPATNTY